MTTSPETRQKISSGGAYESVFSYSRAVRVGPHLHISGTCAPATHERSDAYTQTRAILDVIGKVLAEARMSEADVVRRQQYERHQLRSSWLQRALCRSRRGWRASACTRRCAHEWPARMYRKCAGAGQRALHANNRIRSRRLRRKRFSGGFRGKSSWLDFPFADDVVLARIDALSA